MTAITKPSWFRRHKRLVWMILPPLLILSFFVSEFFFERWLADNDLAAAIADVDQIDPGWRLADIEDNRRKVTDAENSASVIKAAHQALPPNWANKLIDEINQVPPPVSLNPAEEANLRAEVKFLKAALTKARQLVEYPTGRYPLNYTPDFLSTLIPDHQNAREVMKALCLDIRLLIQTGETEKAWLSGRALLNAARSLGDEPLMISPLIRIEGQSLVVDHLERILAHGEVSEQLLADMQKALDEEAGENLFLMGLRGERAGSHLLLSNIENGTLSLTQTLDNIGRKNPTTSRSLWGAIADVYAMAMVKRSHAWLLRNHTKVVETAKQSDVEKYPKLLALEISAKEDLLKNDQLIMAKLLFPALIKAARSEQRPDARLHCAVAALAAERFRLQNKRWPESLEELVKHKMLKEVPVDLYDGRPLRFRSVKDGIVIYSVMTKEYRGDALDDLVTFDPEQFRIEFRLWNPNQRRQPPVTASSKKQGQ